MDKLTLNETSSIHGDIRNLMDSYYNWGELLDGAPLAISVLGKLIVMSHQKMYVPSPHSFFISPNKFNYPKSFRNSLVQMSRQGNLVFRKAHTNMEKIRVYNSNSNVSILLSRHIKSLYWLLMSSRTNESYIDSSFSPRVGSFEIFHLLYESNSLSTEVVGKFQMVLESIEEMIVTAKQLELNRRNTQQDVERNDSSVTTKIYYVEAIKAFQNALNELTKLKNAWMKLIEFYSKMSILTSQLEEKRRELVDFVKAILLEIGTTQLDDEKILRNLTDSVRIAIEASYLVHGVSDMYVNVSEMYIIDQMTHLDKMMNATEVDMDKLQMELSWSTESDAEGIRHSIKADETLLREKIADRHNQFVWMQDCDSNEERQSE